MSSYAFVFKFIQATNYTYELYFTLQIACRSISVIFVFLDVERNSINSFYSLSKKKKGADNCIIALIIVHRFLQPDAEPTRRDAAGH